MKKPEDGNGVIVMKKLTTRGLQALAGGPSRLRSAGMNKTAMMPPAAGEPPQPPPVAIAQPNPRDSQYEVTLARNPKANIALASDEEIDNAAAISLHDDIDPPTLLVEPQADDGEQATLMAPSPTERKSPPPVPPEVVAESVAKAQALLNLPPAVSKRQMAVRTPPTLIHQQHAIPDDIRQLAIRALEMQKTAVATPGSTAGVAVPRAPASSPSPVAKKTVTPVGMKAQPGAPALVKGGVKIVVRETKRRTAFGWTAMLLALGVFVGLSTVAIIHGDAGRAFAVVKQYASQKPAAPASPEPAAVPAPAADPAAVAAAAPPAQPAPVAAPAPTTPDPAVAAALGTTPPAAPTADTKVADNKPAQDPKDESKSTPKPDPKPEVTKPDPAPRPAQKPSNAYASTRAAATSADDKPAPKVAAAPKKDDSVAAKPAPKKDDAVAAKPKPDKDPPVAAAKPDPKPAPKGDDDVAKISQMAQQQLGAALP